MTRTRALLLAAAMLAPFPASASTFYTANIDAVNNSGVAGTISFELSDDTNTLNVILNATGLADGAHFLHVHGLESPAGTPVDTTPPPAPVPPNGDTDGNNVLTTGEAKAGVGDVILSLAPHQSGVSGELVGVQSTGGTLQFTGSYNLLDNGIFERGFTRADLLPLDFRVFDLHGGIVPLNEIGNNGTTTAPGTYDVNLPIGAAAIQLAATDPSVPEPATWAMMIGGFGLVGGAARRRRTSVRYA